MTNRYTLTLLDYFDKASKNHNIRPLILGGFPGSGGGGGGPPGGFIGYLPQTRVAYDYTEAESFSTAISGTLLDNLNHIRARLAVIEASGYPSGWTPPGAGFEIYDDDVLIKSGVTALNFGTDLEVVNQYGNIVTINSTASGIGGSGVGDPLDVYYNGSLLEADITEMDFVGSIVVTNPSVGRVLVSGQEQPASSNTIDILDGVTSYPNVDTIDFGTGLVVTNHGGGNITVDATASGVGHTIQYSGVDVNQRSYLNFTGAVSVTDDSPNDATIVNIEGGGGSSGGSTVLARYTDITIDHASLSTRYEVFTVTIPANTLSTNKTLRITFMGTFVSQVSASRLTFGFLLDGGDYLWEDATASTYGGTGQLNDPRVTFFGTALFAATGATNAQSLGGMIQLSSLVTADANGGWGDFATNNEAVAIAANSIYDMTSDRTLRLYVQSSVSDATYTHTYIKYALVEVV